METDAFGEASVSHDDVDTGYPETESNKVDSLEGSSSNGEVVGELGNAGEFLTRVELDLACSSEKLVNLSVLMMQVATRESDYEAFVSRGEHMLGNSFEKALEFDLLSGILDSEVQEVDKFMSTLQADVISAHEIVSLFKHLGETFVEMEGKLCDSELSLKQSQDQVSEIRMQSAKFQRILASSNRDEHWNNDKGVDFPGDDQFLDTYANIKMQTAEQQRHILRLLEKSLSREMDLEKKLTESRQIEEELKLRLHSSEQEVFFLEEEGADIWERWFQADNATEILMGISKELLGRLHIFQFNLNGAVQREAELRRELERATEQLKSKEINLHKLESSEMDNVIVGLKEKISKAESRAESAEAKCKLLAETNMELKDELGLLKDGGNISEKVNLLERQLQESDYRLQHAVASAEAGEEKQSMLNSTIGDMENLIKDLKLKVLKAETQADRTKEKCIILSESNMELHKELSFFSSRLESLEASLHQAEEMKIANAKDIAIRKKVITDLVMQLSIERERLHKQISTLTAENNNLLLKLQQMNMHHSVDIGDNGRGNSEEFSLPKHDLTDVTCARESKEEVTELSATGSMLDKNQVSVPIGMTKVVSANSTSELESVRRIDAGLLNFKHVLMAIIILLISVVAYLIQK
ncbi:hypothetical protein RGQ29_011682 [Quercus rubra]|uniref:WIT1/2 N-terminal helical bundle domain-containing protein n=2 Tax=Quercus rubra TaxID=3512 RepID=A0AAN7G831_QUERU|nr:hypothetical protein RGQ29_011682 [Quercus rubra]KAK4602774.1 hypothetical protein RGQ29_011682 [Quercus rubra]